MKPQLPPSLTSTPTTPMKQMPASPRLETFQPKSLIACSAGFPGRQYSSASGVVAFSPVLVPQVSGSSSIERVTVRFTANASLVEKSNERISDETVNDPPSTPKRSMSGIAASRPPHRGRSGPVSTIAANTLLLGRDSAFALCPVTLVTQAEALIASSKVEEALALLAAVGTPDSQEKVRANLDSSVKQVC